MKKIMIILFAVLFMIGCQGRELKIERSGAGKQETVPTVLMGGLVCESGYYVASNLNLSSTGKVIAIKSCKDWEDYDLGVILKGVPTNNANEVMMIR